MSSPFALRHPDKEIDSESTLQDAFDQIPTEDFDIDAASAEMASLLGARQTGGRRGRAGRGRWSGRGQVGKGHATRSQGSPSLPSSLMPPPATRTPKNKPVVNYPPDIPTAESVSQRALDELSVTSSQYHEEIEAMKEGFRKMSDKVEELERSRVKDKQERNLLAATIEAMRSTLESKMSSQDGITKGNITQLRSAKEILAPSATPRIASSEPRMDEANIIPTEPAPIRASAMATGGRPLLPKKRNISD